VKKQSSARTGEIVVAMIEGEATVKRYFPKAIAFASARNARWSDFVEKRPVRQTDILGSSSASTAGIEYLSCACPIS